jgi:tetratricopeptide (TPR) repeat protein
VKPLYTTRVGLAVLALGLAGCSSTPETIRRQSDLNLPRPEFEVREPLEFHRAWADVPIDDRGEPSPVELAKWVTERRNAAERALKDEPMRLMQAVEILAAVARRVPDSSFLRQRLAQSYFLGAAMWFKNADAAAFSMDYLIVNNQLPDGTLVETEDDKEAYLKEMREFLDKSNTQVHKWAERALREFMAYRGLRPDDKTVLDSVWKLHFYLQNYDEALRWLDAVIREMDLAEVSEADPLYRNYSLVRKDMVDLIAQLRIDSSSRTPRSLIPSLTESQLDRGEDR